MAHLGQKLDHMVVKVLCFNLTTIRSIPQPLDQFHNNWIHFTTIGSIPQPLDPFHNHWIHSTTIRSIPQPLDPFHNHRINSTTIGSILQSLNLIYYHLLLNRSSQAKTNPDLSRFKRNICMPSRVHQS